MKLARIAVAALVAVSFIFAQDAAAPKAAKAAKKEAVKTVVGTVVSVDAVANTIIVKTKKAEDTLSVESGAKITSGKKEITLGDIKADANVTVKCKTVDGKKVATSINEKAAAAGKAKKEAAPAESAAPAAAPAAEPAAAPAAAPAAEPAK
jgi:pyruvate dehydrogenase E2 component (dihydrolipoamide acetyltransferase)